MKCSKKLVWIGSGIFLLQPGERKASTSAGGGAICRRYVYAWADGVFLQVRMEDHGECMLVLTDPTPEGKKELIGFQVCVRESAQSANS